METPWNFTLKSINIPECVSPGIQERCLALKRGSLWEETVWSASSPEQQCGLEWWWSSEQPGCLSETASIWLKDKTNTSVNHSHVWVNRQFYSNSGRNSISCLVTFTGEGCCSFVHCFSLFCSFRGIFLGHQVQWNSQRASTHSQLKQSSG